MRYGFIILAFCFALPLMGQEKSQLPFNQKSYPQLYFNDSLAVTLENYADIKSILEQDNMHSKSDAKTKRWNMPIIKPESNSVTPVFPIDSTQTYFLQVYPISRG